MSSGSSQNLQPENADNVQDISVPTLHNRFRLLVVPQELQTPLISKTYSTRRSGMTLGKLKGFMDLPMDVVFEVSFKLHTHVLQVQNMIAATWIILHTLPAGLPQTAMYLSPKDLLQLSRLSKQFRSMFSSRRSALFIWQTVIRNVDPSLKCFQDLNEIQFASLLYDKCCMACGRITKGCLTFLALRLRLCACCQSANLITKTDLLKQYPNAKNTGIIDKLPSSSSNSSSTSNSFSGSAAGRKYFKPEADQLIQKFLSLKKKGSSRNTIQLFTANLVQHTRHRQEINVHGYRTKTTCHRYTVTRR